MKHKVGVIGLGKLGLCLALNLERLGFDIQGVDTNDELIQLIKQKKLTSSEPLLEAYLKESKNLGLSNDISSILVEDCTVIFIVVATPSLSSGSYDHSQVDEVIKQILKHGVQKKRKHLVINCTTMPSYCDSIVNQVEACNYSLSYNPEFIAQGSIIKDQQNPDQVLIGSNDNSAIEAIKEVYAKLCKNEPKYCTMSLISAEITKLATNCFLTNKIAFANSIGDLAIQTGAEPDKILDAIGSDSRIGKKYLNYGFGYGGPCFPRDNRALIQFGKAHNSELLLSEATDLSNERHLEFQFKQWMKIPANEAIEFDHVSYKEGTAILEESQQLELALKLANAGRKVKIYESDEVIGLLKSKYGDLFSYSKRDESK